MNRIITTILVAFLFAFTWSFAQEEDPVDDNAVLNPYYDNNQIPAFMDFDYPIVNSDWQWLHPTPQGNTLRWVKAFDDNTWYAVGFGGTFMKTNDAGANWQIYTKVNGLGSSGFNLALYDAHFFDMDNGLACGSGGVIIKTTDAGATWDSVGVPGVTSTLYDLYFVDANLGFAVGSSNTMAKTTDGGMTWTEITTLPSGTYYSVYAVDEDTIITGSSGGDIERSTDGGATWTNYDPGYSSSFYGLNFIDPMNGWICGTSTHALFTTDNGVTWTDVSAGLETSSYYDIDIVDSPILEDLGTVYPMNTPLWTGTTDGTTKTDSSEVRGYDSEDGWFMFDVSSIPDDATIDSIVFNGYVNDNNWPYWSLTPLYLDPLTATAGEIKDSVEANNGSSVAYVYRSESGTIPNDWVSHLMENSANADLTNSLVQDWFAVGFDSRDNSATYYIEMDGWNEANPPYLEIYYTPAGGGSASVYLTGDSFFLQKTTDNGTTWEDINILDPLQPWTSTFYSTDFIPETTLDDSVLVTVGNRGMFNRKGTGPAQTFTNWIKSGTLQDIWAESKIGQVIAVGAPGISSTPSSLDQAMYSTDGGSTWTVSTINGTPDEDFNDISMINNTTGWVAGDEGGIWKTTDGGATWDSLANLGSNLEEVFFVDATTGYTYGSSGNGWKSTDGGLTWNIIDPGHGTSIIRAASFLDANLGYTVGSSGKMYKTTDGGTTTTALDPEMGTSTIYTVHFVDANNGFVAGSSSKIRRTTDGGTTWDTVDVDVSTTIYDIEFRDAMFGSAVGSSGRAFFTTDGGETWNLDNSSASTLYGVSLENTSPDTAAAFVCGSLNLVLKNESVIVPVELANFSSSVNGNTVTLNWTTVTEINNAGFEVERKSGKDWSNVAYIEGHGTTTEQQVYSFVDAGLSVGEYSYRIKQIDYDGSYTYYNLPEVVNVGAPSEFSLAQNYPNPFNPSTKITYAVPVDANVTLAVYNLLGEKVATLVNGYTEAGTYNIDFNASEFSSGVYIYRMEAGDFVSVKKMMLLK